MWHSATAERVAAPLRQACMHEGHVLSAECLTDSLAGFSSKCYTSNRSSSTRGASSKIEQQIEQHSRRLIRRVLDALRSRVCKGRCVQMWPAARWLWRRGRFGCTAPLRPPRSYASPRTPSWSTARASRAARRAGLLAAVPQNRPGHGHAVLAACGRSWRLHACPPSIASIQAWQAHLASATWSCSAAVRAAAHAPRMRRMRPNYVWGAAGWRPTRWSTTAARRTWLRPASRPTAGSGARCTTSAGCARRPRPTGARPRLRRGVQLQMGWSGCSTE